MYAAEDHSTSRVRRTPGITGLPPDCPSKTSRRPSISNKPKLTPIRRQRVLEAASHTLQHHPPSYIFMATALRAHHSCQAYPAEHESLPPGASP